MLLVLELEKAYYVESSLGLEPNREQSRRWVMVHISEKAQNEGDGEIKHLGTVSYTERIQQSAT